MPLMRPDEIMRLKPSQSLIIRSGSSPIKASQFIWYKESSMKNLPQLPSKVPKQIIQQTPFIRAPQNIKEGKNEELALEEVQEFEWMDN